MRRTPENLRDAFERPYRRGHDGSFHSGNVRRVQSGVVSEARKATLSARTAAQTRAVLKNALNQAVVDDLIPINPVTAVRVPAGRKRRPEVPCPGEVVAVLNEARKTPLWEIPILLSATAGMRRSEVLGLAWTEVNFDYSTVTVVRGLHRVPGENGSALAFLKPKSEESARTIPLPSPVMERLRWHKADQARRQRSLGDAWRNDSGPLVCDNGIGGPTDPDAFSHAFKRIAKRAGLSTKVRLHDLRHAFATSLLDKKVDTKIASAMLGHSNPAFTRRSIRT